jgi:predicted ATPase/class 3 adenylate cyclase
MTTIEAEGRGTAGPPLPTGTLTLLFSDIEGSTRLELAVGTGRYAELRERHHELLRAAWAANGGTEIATEGDSFFVVFDRPSAAIGAAVAAQRALAAEAWPPDGIIRVRMGIHTGEVSIAGGTYVGTAINRAARISAAGHGGQVLVSAATRALVADALPGGSTLRDLGAHRLRDLPEAERLFQLTIEGLPEEFASLRGQVGDSLPVQLTSFVGRETELATAERLLATSRLLTLTGPGGIGKTRLSIALAHRAADMFPDGVVFVPLAPIDDVTLVAPTIARALDLPDSGSKPTIDSVVEHVGDKRILFVIDNFEQVLSAAPVVAEILRRTANSTVVLTSRAVLHLSGEQEYEVPGLPVPPDVDRLPAAEAARLPGPIRRCDPDAIGRFEGVRLFVARARAVRPDFELDDSNAWAVARIAARLHGMPLALELAAARVKLRDPAQILERLDDQLALLASSSRDLPERQRTIRGAIAWSVDLLAAAERTLLARLATFVGSFDLDSAVAVAGSDELDELAIEEAIGALVDQSLVRRSGTGPGRTEMLEPIREFGLEQLERLGELEERRERHARHYLAIAEEARPHLAGGDQRRWLDRLELDRDNFRAAIDWSVARPAPDVAIPLAYSLWRYWQKRGYLDEAAARIVRILAAPWSHDDPVLRAKALEAAGGIRYWQGRMDDAVAPYVEATQIWRSLGDRRELANALYNEAFVRGIEAPEESVALLDEARAIYADLGDDVGIGNILWGLGTTAIQQARGPEAEKLFREAREHFRTAGERTMEAWADHMLGATLAFQGRFDEAEPAFDAALRHFDEVADVAGISIVLSDLAIGERWRGDAERAAHLSLASTALGKATGINLMEASIAAFPKIWVPPNPDDLPPGRFEEIAREVAGWSLDEALAYARQPGPSADRRTVAHPGHDEVARASE